jgi:hypothetical protein
LLGWLLLKERWSWRYYGDVHIFFLSVFSRRKSPQL